MSNLYSVLLFAFLISDVKNDVWHFNIHDFTWKHLSSNQTENMNIYVPYPGGLSFHSMEVYQDDIFVFGGTGLDAGILLLSILISRRFQGNIQ